MLIKSLVIGVILPISKCVKMPIGKVKNNQPFLGISNLINENILDRRGDKRYIPKNANTKSKIAYSKKRNCLKYSIEFILILLIVIYTLPYVLAKLQVVLIYGNLKYLTMIDFDFFNQFNDFSHIK